MVRHLSYVVRYVAILLSSMQCIEGFLIIMITNQCNVYPLTSHFYIVKLGFQGYTFLLFLL